MCSSARLQLHLVLPYRDEPRHHPRIRRYLEQGYRIEQYQRLSDHEVVVTVAAPSPGVDSRPTAQ